MLILGQIELSSEAGQVSAVLHGCFQITGVLWAGFPPGTIISKDQ